MLKSNTDTQCSAISVILSFIYISVFAFKPRAPRRNCTALFRPRIHTQWWQCVAHAHYPRTHGPTDPAKGRRTAAWWFVQSRPGYLSLFQTPQPVCLFVTQRYLKPYFALSAIWDTNLPRDTTVLLPVLSCKNRSRFDWPFHPKNCIISLKWKLQARW